MLIGIVWFQPATGLCQCVTSALSGGEKLHRLAVTFLQRRCYISFTVQQVLLPTSRRFWPGRSLSAQSILTKLPISLSWPSRTCDKVPFELVEDDCDHMCFGSRRQACVCKQHLRSSRVRRSRLSWAARCKCHREMQPVAGLARELDCFASLLIRWLLSCQIGQATIPSAVCFGWLALVGFASGLAASFCMCKFLGAQIKLLKALQDRVPRKPLNATRKRVVRFLSLWP